jgi:hypothetical protein
MSLAASELSKRLAVEGDSPEVRRIRALLETPEAQVMPSSGHFSLAGDLEPTYRIRQQYAKSQKRHFVGLPSLVSALQASPASRKIEICKVVGDVECGNLFFDAETGRLVGAVAIKMSAHTRAYYRGELTGKPFENSSHDKKPVTASSRRAEKHKKVMA